MPCLATVEAQEEKGAAVVKGRTTYLGSWLDLEDVMPSEAS